MQDITKGRRELAAGVNRAVGKKCYEIKGCTAAVTCAASKQRVPLFMVKYIKQVIFNAETGI